MPTTSYNGSAPGYSTIPQAVRDFYSKEVLFEAQPKLKFLQFAKIKEDLTAVRGKSIVFVKYQNLSGGGALAEDETLIPKAMGTSEIKIDVTEQGNSIQVTEFLLRTSLLDVLGDASKQLANNMAVVLDTQFRDVAISTTNVVTGGQGVTTPPTTPANLKAGEGLDAATVKDAAELLANNNAPKFNGEYYVCMCHPHQHRQLRDDPAWENANRYMGRRQLYIGEVGMYEGVVFIETTQMPALSVAEMDAKYSTSGGPTGWVSGPAGWEAVMFGENAYAWAVALPVELRDDGVVDMGRKHTLGWYGIWGSGILEEKNIVRIITA